MHGQHKAAAWCGRLLLFAALLLGIVTMHTLGHPAEHGGGHAVAMAHHSAPAPAAGPPAAHAHDPVHGGMDPLSVCLAVLGTGWAAALLLSLTAFLRARPVADPATAAAQGPRPVVGAPRIGGSARSLLPVFTTDTHEVHFPMRTPTRRVVLGAGIAVAGSGLLAACATKKTSEDRFVSPDGKEVAAAEARRGTGPVRKAVLTATPSRIDLGGGRTVSTWAYGDRLPGREIRVTAGDTLALTLANHLPEPTSVHWHGLALRNDMDGAPGVTQQPVKAGASFDYRFTVAHPGTYWLHPHSGVQQDRGLYAPLIVDDPKEPLQYDKEWVVVLDDWVDGVDGSTPDAVLAELARGMDGMDHGSMDHGSHGMPGMSHMSMTSMTMPAGDGGPSRMLMGATSVYLGGDAGDVAYPHYLVNGRTPDDPETFTAEPGDRVRIRLLNAGGDTAFRVALGGHRMTVTHTDGWPVEHTETDALLLGMGERYDVLVEVRDGVFPLTALAEGKQRTAMAVLRTGGGEAPGADVRPRELDAAPLGAQRLKAARDVALADRRPDRTITLRLTGSMAKYDWAIDGRKYTPEPGHAVRSGERVRLEFVNDTTMWHPMHLHGHTFALAGGGPRKDTVMVLPGKRVGVDFDADNPGLWMIHCHNVYHSESGMMTVLGYRG